MSLTITSSESAESRTVVAYSRASSESGVCSSSSDIPTTALIGVRISWLIVARNCDFTSAASIARSCAARIASSAALRWVMSRKMMIVSPNARVTSRPRANSTGKSVPRASRPTDSTTLVSATPATFA
jgi:hypothetical protein